MKPLLWLPSGVSTILIKCITQYWICTLDDNRPSVIANIIDIYRYSQRSNELFWQPYSDLHSHSTLHPGP